MNTKSSNQIYCLTDTVNMKWLEKAVLPALEGKRGDMIVVLEAMIDIQDW